MKTRLILIRHGQSQSNLEDKFAGHTDVMLTELGKTQGKCTGEFLKNEKIDAVYSSELTRAYETACYTAEYHNLKVTKYAGVNEVDGGLWETLTYSEIKEKFPEQNYIWHNNIGHCYCENGESVAQVRDRVYNALEELAKKHSGQTVAIGTHGMALRAFILKVQGLSLDEMQEKTKWASNASVTYVDYEDGKFTLVKYGEDKHLDDAGLKTDLIIKA